MTVAHISSCILLSLITVSKYNMHCGKTDEKKTLTTEGTNIQTQTKQTEVNEFMHIIFFFNLFHCARHADGKVCFWEMNLTATTSLLYCLDTANMFAVDGDQQETASAPADEDWPPFRKVYDIICTYFIHISCQKSRLFINALYDKHQLILVHFVCMCHLISKVSE